MYYFCTDCARNAVSTSYGTVSAATRLIKVFGELKFGFFEKATKIWSYHPHDLTFTK